MSMVAGSTCLPAADGGAGVRSKQVSETAGFKTWQIGPALLQTKSSSATVGRVSCDRHHPI
jgi:hypothetical protein